MRAALDELTTDDGSPDAWVRRFNLDQVQANRLRALFRREPQPGVLNELSEILRLPPEFVALLEDDASVNERVEVIEPRGVRQQLTDELRSEIRAAAPPPTSFRFRHPRLWLTISLAVISGLVSYALIGLIAGRLTALILAVVAAAWMGSLAIEGAFNRAWPPDSPRPDAESPPS